MLDVCEILWWIEDFLKRGGWVGEVIGGLRVVLRFLMSFWKFLGFGRF